jgi:hypothetical protein
MGYGHRVISETLHKNNDLKEAAELLAYEANLKKDQGLMSDGEFVWKPPFTVSIGIIS